MNPDTENDNIDFILHDIDYEAIQKLADAARKTQDEINRIVAEAEKTKRKFGPFEAGDKVRLTGSYWHNGSWESYGIHGGETFTVCPTDAWVDNKTTIRFEEVAQHWSFDGEGGDFELTLVQAESEVEMARLPRDRKGKTPIDVGIVVQDDLTRVRLSMGEDGAPGRKNSDLSVKEAEDLVTMLQYNISIAKGDIKIT